MLRTSDPYCYHGIHRYVPSFRWRRKNYFEKNFSKNGKKMKSWKSGKNQRIGRLRPIRLYGLCRLHFGLVWAGLSSAYFAVAAEVLDVAELADCQKHHLHAYEAKLALQELRALQERLDELESLGHDALCAAFFDVSSCESR